MGDFFNNLVYSNNDIINFPSGIPGFENNKQFVLVSIPEYAPFEWLVCIDGSKLRFAIINPLLFVSDYDPKIMKEQIDDLGIDKPEDLLFFVIVTIRENPLESTANLVGPILINRIKKSGKQVIIDSDQYTTREPILRNK
jgi:flagellar assembly factor FliW